jgi:hypothetical protein
LREAALLVGVFAPFDRILQNQPLTPHFVGATVALVITLLGVGMGIERWRKT